MYEISRAVAHDETRIAQAAADQLRQLFESDTAEVWLCDEGNRKLVRQAGSGLCE